MDPARRCLDRRAAHTTSTVPQAAGERHFMVVRFTPIGAHLFLGLPMHLIANDAIDLEQIDSALARSIADRVARGGVGSERFDAMEALIAARIADARMSGSIALAWRKLVAADGRVVLGSLARELDCSHRTLIARFRTTVGLPPKTVARLLRFNRVVRCLDRASRTRANETVGKPYIESARARRTPRGYDPLGRHRRRLRLLRSGAPDQRFPRFCRRYTRCVFASRVRCRLSASRSDGPVLHTGIN